MIYNIKSEVLGYFIRKEETMQKSYIADNIMKDYIKKKRYKQNKERAEFELFKRKVCADCKNKGTNLCHVVRNINGVLQCVFKE